MNKRWIRIVAMFCSLAIMASLSMSFVSAAEPAYAVKSTLDTDGYKVVYKGDSFEVLARTQPIHSLGLAQIQPRSVVYNKSGTATPANSGKPSYSFTLTRYDWYYVVTSNTDSSGRLKATYTLNVDGEVATIEHELNPGVSTDFIVRNDVDVTRELSCKVSGVIVPMNGASSVKWNCTVKKE